MKRIYNSLKELMSSCDSSELKFRVLSVLKIVEVIVVTNEEIALQLTLKALECGRIEQRRLSGLAVGSTDRISPFNMKLICDAYKTALKELSSTEG